MRVSACGGFAYKTVKLVKPANCYSYEVDSNTYFVSGKALLCPFKILSCPNSNIFSCLSLCVDVVGEIGLLVSFVSVL
jgi:hypothetical protein